MSTSSPSLPLEETNLTVPLFKVFVSAGAQQEVQSVLSSGTLTQGPVVAKFEDRLRSFLDCPLVDTVNSATSGLQLALHVLKAPHGASGWPGLKPGDKVLAPALTCFASTCSILNEGLDIEWLDSDPLTGSTSILDIMDKLTPQTKVIQVVHWGGTAADVERLDTLLESARSRLGFVPFVIEDCAHAFGARYPQSQKRIGSQTSAPRIQVFSFQAIKTLTCGDGGCICFPTTEHGKELSRRARLLRWFGIERGEKAASSDSRLEADVPEHGFKFHMNDYNAALGLRNLPHVPGLIARARANSKRIRAGLAGLEHVRALHAFDYEFSSCWLLSVWVSGKQKFLETCRRHHVMASQVHRRNDTHSAVARFAPSRSLCGVDEIDEHLVCLPCGWWLSQVDIDRVLGACRAHNSTMLRAANPRD